MLGVSGSTPNEVVTYAQYIRVPPMNFPLVKILTAILSGLWHMLEYLYDVSIRRSIFVIIYAKHILSICRGAPFIFESKIIRISCVK